MLAKEIRLVRKARDSQHVVYMLGRATPQVSDRQSNIFRRLFLEIPYLVRVTQMIMSMYLPFGEALTLYRPSLVRWPCEGSLEFQGRVLLAFCVPSPAGGRSFLPDRPYAEQECGLKDTAG